MQTNGPGRKLPCRPRLRPFGILAQYWGTGVGVLVLRRKPKDDDSLCSYMNVLLACFSRGIEDFTMTGKRGFEGEELTGVDKGQQHHHLDFLKILDLALASFQDPYYPIPDSGLALAEGPNAGTCGDLSSRKHKAP